MAPVSPTAPSPVNGCQRRGERSVVGRFISMRPLRPRWPRGLPRSPWSRRSTQITKKAHGPTPVFQSYQRPASSLGLRVRHLGLPTPQSSVTPPYDKLHRKVQSRRLDQIRPTRSPAAFGRPAAQAGAATPSSTGPAKTHGVFSSAFSESDSGRTGTQGTICMSACTNPTAVRREELMRLGPRGIWDCPRQLLMMNPRRVLAG